ncbi:hypothetical protein F4861DRAFT_102286 [Xylaria intraflava]|nr:hypothetical protein F4861DRAFT_102286 [Xylaria intraflava]
MVYCGQPSRGCQMCRTRRIKCDETKPTCNRCAKSRRQCPGYKDDFDLVFRNETQATERRAQKVNRKALTQKAGKGDAFLPDTASSLSPLSAGAAAPGLWPVTPPPALSLQERAACNFVANFILMPKDGRTVGHFAYVLPLLKQEGPDSHLQHAFNACSLAFMDNRRGVRVVDLWDKTLSEYLLALGKTNAALRDKDSQLSDATLATVLLLGMFESISAKQINASSWGSHIKGAVQLVKARGKKQVKTRTGLQLFVAVRSLMTVYCLASDKAPSMGAEWWLEDTEFGKTDLGVRNLMIKTSELRAQMMQIMARAVKTPQTVELMLDIIRKAQAMDREVMAWQQGVPADWGHTTVAWEDSVPEDGDYSQVDVFPGRVDVYNDIWIASSVNTGRAVRLILHAVIVRCAAWVCAPVDYRITPEYVTATSVCRDAITDIIASVPYFLGWHLKRKGMGLGADDAVVPGDPPAQTSSFGSFACGEEDSIKGLAGYLITWPLTVVISQDYVTDSQRSWVLGRLRKIGGDFGIRYALAMSQLQMRAPSMMIRRDELMHSHPMLTENGSSDEAGQRPPGDATHRLKTEHDDRGGLQEGADAAALKREWPRT